MYLNATYNNAQTAAEQMSNEELVAAHIDYMQRDGQILAAHPGARGIVDDPYWSYIKYEARRRGVDLVAAYEASFR